MDSDRANDQSGQLQVGDLLINLGTHEVRREGQAVALPQLSYRLLLVLADAAPNIVTYDALVERVWNGVIVSHATVTQRIKLLRQAIGDDARDPRYIGLVRGEGYRLLAAVKRIDRAAPETNSTASGRGVGTRASIRIVATTIAALATLATIAVIAVGAASWF